VKNLSFDLRAGEIFGLIVQRLRQIDRHEGDHGHRAPDRGDVIFQGENLAGLPAHKIARKVLAWCSSIRGR